MHHKTEMLIIGAGFSGLTMALEARKRGLSDLAILEKADDIGGTWRENTYPGVACDVPSHLYSMATHPNPHWSRAYAGGAEIQAYLKGVAQHEGLYDLCHFGQELKAAKWDGARWQVETMDGQSWSARFLVSAIGALHHPSIPDLPGADGFPGPCFHSAQWDHDVDLTGKRVAVVGTGASAVQFVPEIAKLARHVTIFQRSAPYVMPRPDGPIAPWVRKLYAHLPLLPRIRRKLIFMFFEFRHRVFRGEERAMNFALKMWRKSLEGAIIDPEERRILTPDYQIGCKRILSSNDWYPTLARDNVSVVPQGVARIDRDTLITSDGTKVQADALIWGTGFHVTNVVERLDITGSGGLTLRTAWADGMNANLGTAIAGFPNFFILLGPHTGLGHNSVVLMIEAQVGHIGRVLSEMQRKGIAAITPDAKKQAGFTQEMQDRHADSVWQTGGCTSWYIDEDGRNTTLWPGTVGEYQARMAQSGLEQYTTVGQETAR
ncbi:MULTISPECIES: NAD(P)/FAD-dependent oxidoreductase [unclassified Ruegeria]|uniref:flavin-containing monooxygenase n=1 Tax=unclassified Ruegeria TaxID=2625375 RepID=UPI001489DDD8|nr:MULTISPECIES: NAD(P)/FAD-dependent oxidoreductase [unclassified Ruegeria]NOD48953.1 NAD(P)-binding domain-containing protein [Ruegeria sp. HKCCD5849]NOD53600.1 NAD(P)-binding domain-containing protein [Ruegeria sp. HKCCD5851]NOD69475.1 NAD(P)-binding domain-containing protein [Ruegeria sp. HKCCD7303]NOE32259.1 NAD(P)-binding domain-containing protein [Ruegeria sp. HKCCD7318]